MKPARCWGPAEGQHRTGCRRDRPLCRWRRKAYAGRVYGFRGVCQCSAYPFPHRPRSGDCTVGGGSGGGESEAAHRDRMEASAPKTRCPGCGTVHRDHSR